MLAAGTTIGGYRVEALAGRGGMGTVYRATQLSLGRVVALKVIAASLLGDERALERFRSEARLAAMLDHPNLVDVLDAGEADGVTFIAMRFVEGPDLAQILRAGPMDPARSLRLLAQVAAGLDTAHTAGIVHRDVKPANILVAAGDHAVLTDFGLTRPMATALPATGAPAMPDYWAGSPDYVAPEQIRGEPTGPAGDVYSLGGVLFRMLAGCAPFGREARDARLWAHLHAAPPVPSRIRSELAPFDAVITRALAKEPELRYASAGELAGAAAEAAVAAGIDVSRAAGANAPFADTQRQATPTANPIWRPYGDGPVSDEATVNETEPGAHPPIPSRISSRSLVGRGEELALLHAALDQAADGISTITWVGGEAGIGKSRLIHELGLAAHARGMRVLAGACAGLDSAELPYAPIVAALRRVPNDALRSATDRLEASARAELARLLPELELHTGAPTTDAAPPARSSQARLFELLRGLLRDLCAETPALVVLEDMHWADPATRDFARYLCARGGVDRLAIVATYRSDELGRSHPLRALLGALSWTRRTARIELRRLTRAEVAVQLGEILDAAPAATVVDEIFDRSQGNPLFAEELLAVSRDGDGAPAALPPSLRDALLVRFDGLSHAARTVIRTAAVLGRTADHALLLCGLQGPEDRAARALREAVDGHVLTADGDRLRFRHALMREAVYGDLLAIEREQLHRRVAAALSRPGAAGDPGDPGDPAELAHHWDAAGEPGLALSASIQAGLNAARTYAFDAALGHFEHAIALWDAAGDAVADAALDLAGLLAHVAEAAWCVGEMERAARDCRRALNAIDHDRDPDRAAALYERLGRYSASEPETAIASYERALQLLAPAGPSAQSARVLGSQALALTYLDRWDEARSRSEEALSAARAAASPADEAHALSTLGMALTFLGRPDEGEPMLRTALAIAERLGRLEDVARAHIGLAEVFRYLGHTAAALGVATDGEAAARRAGLGDLFGSYLSLSAADDLFQLGRWDEAQRRLATLDPERLERTSRELWLSVAGRIAAGRGDVIQARSHLLDASALCADGRPEAVPHVYGALAELALWQGRSDEACRIVDDGLALLGDGEDALNTPVLLTVGVRAHVETALSAPKTTAERRAARATATELTARLERILTVNEDRLHGTTPGEAHLKTCHAELTRRRTPSTAGRDRSAAAAWACAAEAWEAIEHPYQAAYARFRQAEALRGGRRREQSVQPLAAASEVASRLGAAPLCRAIQRLADAADTTPTPVRPRVAQPV